MLESLGLVFGESGEAMLFDEEQTEITSLASLSDRWLQIAKSGTTDLGKWGVAGPRLLQYADAFLRYAPSVRFVFVVRDVLASSFDAGLHGNRAQPRLAVEYAVELAYSLQRLQLLPVPTLLLSYERCLQDPESAVSLLEVFCGLTSSETIRSSALSVMAEAEAVHRIAAKSDYRGRLDRVVDGRVIGWAQEESGKKAPAKVVLYVDGQRVAVSDANLFREDLVAAGVGDGHHGFEFALPRGTSPTAVLSVRVGRSLQVLENSGLPLRDY